MALPSAPIIYPKPRSLLTSVMLWWQPPADPGSSPITGYVITNPQIAYSKTMPANSNQVTVTGLSAGIDYTFAVAAQNANGTGPPSYFKTVQVGKPPSSPTNIVASLVTDNDALLTWSYSQTAGEAPVRYFIITPVPVIPGSAPSTVSWTYAPFSTMIIQDLSTSIEYTFLVQAINDVRYSRYDSFSNRLIVQVSWSPTNILNIQFWFDASKIKGLTDGENLTSWADQTGISAVNTAPMWDWPEYKEAALNGLSVIRFTPRTLLLVSPQLPVNTLNPTSQSFFAVSRQTGGLNRRIFSSYLTNQYIGYNSGQKQTLYMNGPPDYYNNTPSDSSWDIISLVLVDNTSSNFYWNGTSIFTSNLANNIDSLSFNGTGDTSDCEIAEVIFYNANVSTEERQVVEGYLAWKWALQANLPANHPYKTSPPAVNFTNKIPPTSFTSISQSSASSSAFTISWVGTTGATAFTYTINGEPATPTSETSNSATFSNLSDQTGYTIVVTARNLYGQTVSLPFTAYLAPTQPQNISITNALTNGFTVNWEGGNGATSYLYSLNGTLTLPQADQGTAHNYATFNGLVPNVNYTIIIIPINTGGQTPSDPYLAQTAPAQVTGLGASNIESFTFNLSWSAAAGATGYDYQITPNATVVITGTTARVTNTYPLTQYIVSIIAKNDFGGTTSPSINVTTLPSVFNPYIVGGSNTPIGAQITWVSTTGVTYQYTIAPGLNNAASTLVRNVRPPLTLSTLYPNSTYTVTFGQIVGSVTATIPSFDLITTPSVPSTATAVRYSSATISSFQVFWNTGFATSSLTFYWGPNNITKPYTQTSPITFSTLLSGTAYPVYIKATNVTGSVSSLNITAYTLPGPTYNLVTVGTTPTSITIGWSGGNGATAYIYTVNGVVTTPTVDNGVSGKTATFSGLDTSTAYTFTVTPVSDAGVGQTIYSPESLSPYYWFDANDAATFSSTLTNGNTAEVLTWSNKGSVSTTAVITSPYPNNSTVFTKTQINGLQAISLAPSSFFALSPYISPLANPTYSVFVIFKGITQLTDNTSYVFNMNPVAATSRILFKANTFYMTTGQQTEIQYRLSNISSPNALLSTLMFSMVINGAATSAPQGAWFNGSNQPTVSLNTGGVTGTAFNAPNSLGNDSSQGPTANYSLGEFLIVPSVLTARDRQNVEGYLAWKWGIQASLPSNHPNKTGPPSGTWSLESGPGAPTSLSTSAITYNSFVLYWQGALGATSLTFYVGASVLSTTNTTAPYTISSLSAFTTYPVYMEANSPSGNTSSILISVQTAPAQPSIYASTVTRNSFDLYYSNTVGASSLTIFYNTSSITVPASRPSPLRVAPLNSGSTYTVYMDAVNPTNHTLSNTISVITQYPPPPAVALGRIGPGNSPFLAYSVDGVRNWEPITYPPWTSITGGVATSGPLYLMILNNDANTLYSSLDCKNWSPVGSPDALFGEGPSPTGVALNGIAYGNGIWIAVVNQWIFASTNDGQTWRRSNQYFAGRVFFANNKFFCESQAINQLQISTDGLNWLRCVTNMNANSGAWGLRSIVWDIPTSKYIASGYAGTASSNATLFWTSPDGSIWTPANQSALTWTTVNPSANYLTYAFDKWWTTNDAGYALCYSSDNGLTWQGVSPAGLPKDLISLYANGYLVATSPSQGWYYTSDGVNWSRLESGNALSSSGYNGYYYIFGTNIATSSLAPSGLSIGNVTTSSFAVSWYGAIGASSLTIHYNSSTITIPANTPSPYIISSLIPANYDVYITATSGSGQTADSDVYSVQSPPSAPQNLMITNPTLTSVDISWSGGTNASSLTFYYNTSSITINALTEPSPYTITNLTSSMSYSIYVVATNTTTSVSSATVVAKTAVPPAAPATNLTTSDVNASSLSLSWSGGSGASSITIYYNNNPITFPASRPPPFTISPLSAGSTFTLYMETTNSAGQNTSSNSISVFTPPLSATSLSIANFSISSFSIAWSGSQGASSLTFHYNSSRQTVRASQTSPFTISSLIVGSTFTVYIDATNSAGKISSNSITAYTVATPSLQQATAITNSSFQLTWSNIQGTSSLTFFYNTLSITVPTSTATPYTISSLAAGSTFTVYMNATAFGVPPVSSNSISVLTSPIQPSGVAASNNTNSSFAISWSNAQGASSLTFNYNSSTLTVPASQTSPYSISSLTAGSTYTVYIQATNNTATVSSNNITTYTAAVAPTNLVASNFSLSSFAIAWSNAQGASSLTFHYNSASLTVPATQTSPYTISSLNQSTTYAVYINAITSGGLQTSSLSINATTYVAPSPLTGLSVSNNMSTSFAVNWSGAQNASSLTFYYNSNSLTVPATQTSPYTISSLAAGSTYTVYMDAVNIGAVTTSNTITAYTNPNPPANLNVNVISYSTLSVVWSNAQGASSLTFYYNSSTLTVQASQSSPYLISSLNAGSTYVIYIDAIADSGLHTSSNTISVITDPKPAQVLTAINNTPSSFAIQWSGAEGASSLTFFYNSASLTVPGSQSSPYTISSLTAGSSFTIKIDATEGAGVPITSNEITAYTSAVAAANLTASNFSLSSFAIAWSNVQGASSLTFYYNSATLTVPASQPSPYTISSLNQSTTYAVYIVGTTSGGLNTSSLSINVSTYVAPSPPTSLSVSNNTSGSFAISWSGAANASSLTFYYNSNSLTVPATQTSPYTISSLTAGTSYTVYINAVNIGAQTSSQSITANTAPGTTEGLAASAITPSSLSLTWLGGGGASSLIFYYNTSNVSVPAQSPPYILTNLTAGSTYSIYLDAVTATGLRASTNTISVLTAPLLPTSVATSNPTTTSFQISWLGAQGASSLTFRYNSNATTVNATQTSPYTLTTVTAGSTYNVSIDATNQTATASSASVIAYTQANVATGLSYSNPTATSFAISWSNAQGASSLTFYYNTFNTTVNAASQSSPYTLNTSITAGSSYTVYIASNTSGGLTTNSNTITAYTTAVAPSALAASGITYNSANIAWSGAQGASSLTFYYNSSSTTVPASQTSPYTMNTFTAGSTYTIYINTTTLNGLYASSNTISVLTAPLAATGIAISNQNVTSFDISWSGAQGASSLTFYYNSNTVTVANQASPYTLATATAGSTYTVYINATNPTAIASSGTITAYTKAYAAISLSYSNPTQTSFQILWSGAQGASSLTFFYNNFNQTVNAASQASPLTITTSVTAGSTYTVLISSITSGGLVTTSNTLSAYTTGYAATSLSYSNPTQTSFVIAWSGAQGASSLTFFYNNFNTTVNAASQASPLTITASLTAGTTYTVLISTITSGGLVTTSNTVSAYTSAYAATSLSYSNPTQTSFQILWSGAQGASSLTFFYNNFNTTVNAASQASPLTITTSVTAGSTYTVLISSITSGGLVTTSNTVSAYTSAYAPTSLSASGITSNSANISWSGAQGAANLIFKYNSNQVSVGGSQTSPYTLTSLTPGTSYTVYIEAVTAVAGLVTSSQSISVLTAPLAATSVATGSYSQTGFQITWSGAQGASSLTFRYNSNSVTVANQSSPYNLTGLTAGSTYSVSIDATNATATASSATTNGFTTAYAPTGLVASNQGTNSFAIAWSGAQGASSLTFNYNSSSVTVPASQSSPYTITSLASNTSYTVYITATTSGGQTTNSASINTATITPPPPTAITGVSTTVLTQSSMTVGWSGGNGATSYTYILNGTTTTPSSDNGVASKTASFINLTAGTSYSLRITAVNAGGSATSGSSLTSVGGVHLWFDGKDPLNTGTAPADGTSITTWFDKSGNGYNTTGKGDAGIISYNNASGLYFPGPRNGFTTFSLPNGSFPAGNSAFSVYFVGSFDNPSNDTAYNFGNNYAVGLWNNNGTIYTPTGTPGRTITLSNTGFAANQKHQTSLIYNPGVSATLVVDGIFPPPSSAVDSNPVSNNITSTDNYLGRGVGNTMVGYMSEIIVFNVAHDAGTRQNVEGYLAWKWGAQTYLPTNHPYYSAAPTGFPFVFRTQVVPFSPTTSITGAQLWFDASDPLGTGTAVSNGTNITTWYDKSGNGLHTTAVTGTIPYNSTTGGLTFNGSSYFTLPDGALPFLDGPFSMYVVVNNNDLNCAVISGGTGADGNKTGINFLVLTSYVLLQAGNGQSQLPWSNTNKQNSLVQAFYNSASGDSSVAINGGVRGTRNVGPRTMAAAPNYIGCDFATTSRVTGTIYEILVFNAYHTVTQYQDIEGYLAWKWNLQSQLPGNHPYKSVPPGNPDSPASDAVAVPTYWFDAADSGTVTTSGGNVTAWTNKGVGGNPNTGVNIVNGITINSKPTLLFNSGGNLRLPDYACFTYEQTIFVVFQPPAVLPDSTGYWFMQDVFGSIGERIFIYSQGQTSANPFYITVGQRASLSYGIQNGDVEYDLSKTQTNASIVGVPNVLTIVSSGKNSSLPQGAWLNGVNRPSSRYNNGGKNSTLFSGSVLGGWSNSASYYMGEFISFPYVLPTNQRQKMEGYLAWKWGSQSSLPSTHPYRSVSPSVTPLTLTTPAPILTYWFDAADSTTITLSGSNVTNWINKGVGGNPTATANVLNGVTINSKPTVRFTSNGYFRLPNYRAASYKETVFVVFQPIDLISGSGFGYFFMHNELTSGYQSGESIFFYSQGPGPANFYVEFQGQGGIGAWGSGGAPASNGGIGFNLTSTSISNSSLLGKTTLLSIVVDSNKTTLPQGCWINGTNFPSNMNNNGGKNYTTYDNNVLGKASNNTQYYMAEYISYAEALTQFQREQIEGYLAWKWGFQSSLPANHTYKSVAPSTLPSNLK